MTQQSSMLNESNNCTYLHSPRWPVASNQIWKGFSTRCFLQSIKSTQQLSTAVQVETLLGWPGATPPFPREQHLPVWEAHEARTSSHVNHFSHELMSPTSSSSERVHPKCEAGSSEKKTWLHQNASIADCCWQAPVDELFRLSDILIRSSSAPCDRWRALQLCWQCWY